VGFEKQYLLISLPKLRGFALGQGVHLGHLDHPWHGLGEARDRSGDARNLTETQTQLSIRRRTIPCRSLSTRAESHQSRDGALHGNAPARKAARLGFVGAASELYPTQ